MEFQFISNNGPINDRQSRKLIRSHVMKGRNSGKNFPERGRKKAAEKLATSAPNRDASSDSSSPEATIQLYTKSNQWSASILSPLTGSEYDYFDLPVRLTTSMRYLVFQFHSSVTKAVYPTTFCQPPKYEKHPWFEAMLSNEIFFHTLFIMTATFLVTWRGEKDGPKMLDLSKHFSRVIRLLNQDLSSSKSPKASTIAVVMSLAIHANLTGSVEESRMHLNGLSRLLEVSPGGLAGLRESNPSMLQKICRTDIEYSLREGTSTKFGSTPTMMQCSALASTAMGATGNECPGLTGTLNRASVEVRCIARDVLALCRFANRDWGKLEAFLYQDVVISIFQRLLDFAPLRAQRPLLPIDEAWQLGLLAFMTTILHGIINQRALYTDVLTQRLRSRLSDANFCRDNYHRRLRFWLFFNYSYLVLEICDGRWLVPEIRKLAGDLRLETWEQVKQVLVQFPWIDCLHTEPAQRLWKMAEPSTESGEYVKYLAFGI